MPIVNNEAGNDEGEIPIRLATIQEEDGGNIQLTAELVAELLDAESWGKILGLYANTMKLAVALVDANGELVGDCHNPQPIWILACNAGTDWPGSGCLFCLERKPHCTAAADARRTNSLVLAHDQGGFAHVAIPLAVAGQHVGTLLAGQVLNRYAELLPLHRIAREFDLSPQDVWHLGRQQHPVSRANLTIYGELLEALSQTFLRDRYSAILETRSTQAITALNQELAAVNATLNRKVAELDQAKDYLQHLFESNELAKIFLDHELRIEKFTPAAGKWFRLDAGDIGRPLSALAERFGVVNLAEEAAGSAEPVAGGLIERITEIVRAFPPGSAQDHSVLRELNLTGAEGKYYLLRLYPYRRAKKGMINGAFITFIDVSDLKKAEHLIKSEKLYAENIVATVPEPLLVLDNTFRVQLVNDAFYKTFKTKADETEGCLLFELGNRQWEISELRRLLIELLPKNQWVEELEVEHDFENLGRKTMLINARRIADGEMILLAIRDITERKQSENALRKLNFDLKNFSHAASHDLQEPLRAVSIYSELLAQKYKGKLDTEGDEYIDFVTEGAQQTVTLLKELREYWLVSDGVARFAPVDCEAVFEKVMRALRVPIRDSGASVTHEPLPTLQGDEVALGMLFQNLLGNAIKYRHKGEPPSVHVAVWKTANAWCFSIRDNGIGIQAEYLEEVFAPFKRLHGSAYPGTGLGLALCHKIVERYGGRIWVESIIGREATFYFTIPDKPGVVH